MELLRPKGIYDVDKRRNGGALWMIGGSELKDVVQQCREMGAEFTYKKGGGKATQGKERVVDRLSRLISLIG